MFFIVHVTVTFFVTVEYYYRWEIRLLSFQCLQSLKEFFRYIISKPHCPPKQMVCEGVGVLN